VGFGRHSDLGFSSVFVWSRTLFHCVNSDWSLSLFVCRVVFLLYLSHCKLPFLHFTFRLTYTPCTTLLLIVRRRLIRSKQQATYETTAQNATAMPPSLPYVRTAENCPRSSSVLSHRDGPISLRAFCHPRHFVPGRPSQNSRCSRIAGPGIADHS
jgi:hypothetical protein